MGVLPRVELDLGDFWERGDRALFFRRVFVGVQGRADKVVRELERQVVHVVPVVEYVGYPMLRHVIIAQRH